MTILGAGADVVDVARFERALGREGEGLLREFLCPSEIARCRRSGRPLQAYAVLFAAKEATLKALGTGRSGRISWLDLEILVPGLGVPPSGRDVAGPRCPTATLSGEAARVAAAQGVLRTHLTVARAGGTVVAWAVMEGVPGSGDIGDEVVPGSGDISDGVVPARGDLDDGMHGEG